MQSVKPKWHDTNQKEAEQAKFIMKNYIWIIIQIIYVHIHTTEMHMCVKVEVLMQIFQKLLS